MSDLTPPGFITRPGTFDANIFDSVHTLNEYGLPERFGWNDAVVDIGCHIGSFAYTCLMRGADAVYGYEVNPENLGIAASNLAEFGTQFVPHLAAVWRSDGHSDALTYLAHHNPRNTGGGDVLHRTDGRGVLAMTSLDEIVGGIGEIRLLKLDCEGSEYPILYTASDDTFSQIDEIVGEWHLKDRPESCEDLGSFHPEALVEFLGERGYEADWIVDENDGELGKFRAVRK
jgi:FkbM family methyltransferase